MPNSQLSMKTTKTHLVTGGAGFIGCNFVRHALKNRPDWNIINLDALTYAGNRKSLEEVERDFPDRYQFVRGDICDQSLLEEIFDKQPLSVIHFAAESHVDRSITGPEAFVQTNVMGTFRLLETALKYWQAANPKNFRFLHVSTDEVYGSLGPVGYFTETTPYDPSSPYSASKAASDHFVNAYHRTYGLPTLTTNCSNNYGPYQYPEKLIPLMILNCVENKPLPVYGDGKNVRDWLYVLDHCEAILQVLERGKTGETYNVGGNSEKENIEIVHLLCELLDERLGRSETDSCKKLITFVEDRLGHDRRYAIDSSKLKRELGWEPAHRFDKGIEETVDWYLNNMDWVNFIRNENRANEE